MDIKNKNIVITGGGQGLGFIMALNFAKSGANIALIDVNEEALKESVSLIKAEGVKAEFYVTDVTN
jgi:3-oxoacyl-[acyl-carrier protein] reductase